MSKDKPLLRLQNPPRINAVRGAQRALARPVQAVIYRAKHLIHGKCYVGRTFIRKEDLRRPNPAEAARLRRKSEHVDDALKGKGTEFHETIRL